MFFLNDFIEYSLIFTPWISISPSCGFIKIDKKSIRVDLPEPDFPIIAVTLLAGILRFNLLNTSFFLAWY